jgi:hypothetical protein
MMRKCSLLYRGTVGHVHQRNIPKTLAVCNYCRRRVLHSPEWHSATSLRDLFQRLCFPIQKVSCNKTPPQVGSLFFKLEGSLCATLFVS